MMFYFCSALSIWAFLVATNGISCSIHANNNAGSFVATDQIEAEDFTSASKFYVYDDCTSSSLYYVGSLGTTSVLEYDQVDFGSGVDQIILHFSNVFSSESALNISLHLDSSTNPPFVTFPVDYSGSDKCNFTTSIASLFDAINGTQNLFFTFPSSEGENINLDWFSFNKTKAQLFNATDIIQAEDYTSAIYMEEHRSCIIEPTTVFTRSINAYSVLEYAGVDFGTGVNSLFIRLVNDSVSLSIIIEWRLGSATNPPFLSQSIINLNIDEPCNFFNIVSYFDPPLSGVQDLFITFPLYASNVVNLDWFSFNKTKEYNASEKIQAEDYNSISGNYATGGDCWDWDILYIGSVYTNTILEYSNVDFGSGVDTFVLHYGAYTSSSPLTVSLHLGDSTNPPILNVSVSDPESYTCNYTSVDFRITDAPFPPSGVQDLYLTFPSVGSYQKLNLDWFYFDFAGSDFIATNKIEAEKYSASESVALYDDCTDPNIYYIESQSTSAVLQFKNVDFGDGVEMVTMRVANGYSTTTLHVALRLDSTDSTPIATIPVGYTGSETCNFRTVDTFLEAIVSGVHHLLLTFDLSSDGPVDVDWFVFNKTTTGLN